jgi:hypothetical protein
MKKNCNLILFLFFALNVCAQNSQIAIIKYEQAEEYFNKSDFKKTIACLKECESLLGLTNPKILFLKIIAQSKLIEQDPFTDYLELQQVRSNIDKYLKEYENIPDNQEKYKQIYFTLETLEKYPKSIEEFNKQKGMLLAEKNKKRDTEQKRLSSIAYMETWAEKYKFKTGLTETEFYNYNEDASKIMRELYRDQYDKKSYNNFLSRGFPSRAYSVRIKEEKVVGYERAFWWSKNAEEPKKSYDIIKEELMSNIDPQYLDFTTKGINQDYTCTVKIPGSQILVEVFNMHYNKWYYTLVYFSDQNIDK